MEKLLPSVTEWAFCVSDDKWIEIYTALSLVSIQIAVTKLKKYKSPGSDQIQMRCEIL
jgi:hypothetical protein